MKKFTKSLLLFTLLVFTGSVFSQALDEDFESGTWPPEGWLEIQLGDDAGWQETEAYSNSSSHSAFHNDDNVTTGCDDWLISNELDLSSYTLPLLFYWERVNYATYADMHNVLYSTNYTGSGDPTLADWTMINDVIDTENAWVEKGGFALPNLPSIFIAFQYVGDFASEWWIDDVLLIETPSCLDPEGLSVANITATSADLSWTDNAGASLWDIELLPVGETPTGIPTAAGVSNPYTYDGLDANASYNWYVRADCGGEDYSEWVGASSFTTPPTCPLPTLQTEANITESSVDLGWTDNAGALLWDIELLPEGETPTGLPTVAGVSNPYTYEGLEANTSYNWYVRADCGGEDYSEWVGFSFFTTSCGVFDSPFIQDFEGTYVPDCWFEATGDAPEPTLGSSAWAQSNFANVSGNSGVKMNVYGTDNEWLITPEIDLGAGNKLVKFKVAATNFSGTNSVTMSPEDTVFVLVSSSDSWDLADAVTYYTDTITPSNVGDDEAYELTGWTGVVKFAFYTKGTGYAPDMDFHFDDFIVEEIPDCMAPSNLVATDITTETAMIGWTANGEATQWNIEYGESGFTPTETPSFAGVGNPYLLEGLSPATSYDVYVQSDCGTKVVSPWVGPIPFTTLCEVLTTFPFIEDFEGTVIPDCWSKIVTSPNDITQSSTQNHTDGGEYSARFSSFSSGGDYNQYLFMPQMTIDEAYVLLSFWHRKHNTNTEILEWGIGTGQNPDDYTWTAVELSNTEWQESTVDLTEYIGETVYIAFHYWGNFSYYVYLDDVSVDVKPPPGYVSGVVSETLSGVPVENVTVTAEPGTIQTVSNALGEYELELEIGEYELSFTHMDYYPYTESGVVIVSEETTPVDVSMELYGVPDCAEIVTPLDGVAGVLPDVTLEWAPAEGAPAFGYIILLYNITNDVWLENETDLGDVTTYTPAEGFEWGCQYVWLIKPYNNAGEVTDCIPFYFTTAFSGSIDGLVEDSETGLPVEGVYITLTQVFPNPGFSMDFMTDAEGNWDIEWETGIYDVMFWKYGYTHKILNNITINANEVTVLDETLDPVVSYQMPFVEQWDDASYAAQQWSFNTSENNWYMALDDGNPGPAAIFYYNPPVTDYDMSLQSYYVDARDETEVFAQFDLLLSMFSYNTYEALTFMVHDGTQWNIVETFDNQGGSFDYTSFTYDISDIAAGNQILLGFRATGADVYNINWWLLDNILITNSIMEVEPESISEALFPGETSVWDIDIQNYGFGDLAWNAELILPAAWATLSQTAGIAAPGGQTIQLTFDANAVVPGTYEGEIVFTDDAGLFEKTVAIALKAFDAPGQKIMIPEPGEWGYISSYINLDAKMSLEEAMADVVDEMVILIGEYGVFWPAYDINTLGNYDTYQGYKMKMAADGALAFVGEPVADKVVSYSAGTHIVPVLSTEPVSVETIFLDQPVEYAFGLDGSIYWPAGGIQTLNQLVPGYGYLVKFNDVATLNFNAKALGTANTPPKNTNLTDWNNVNRTGDVHIIGVSALAASELVSGDVLGVFGPQGLCAAMAEYPGNGQPFALSVFANDNTTEEQDGMNVYEALSVRVFRDGQEFELNPVYNTSMPNYDGTFDVNGLSMIDSFKLGATAIGETEDVVISIYPNPSSGMINIVGAEDASKLMVSNSQGQTIYTGEITNDFQLDLTGQATGIYFIKLIGEKHVTLEKVIIQ